MKASHTQNFRPAYFFFSATRNFFSFFKKIFDRGAIPAVIFEVTKEGTPRSDFYGALLLLCFVVATSL
jgi:hypothetical protein